VHPFAGVPELFDWSVPIPAAGETVPWPSCDDEFASPSGNEQSVWASWTTSNPSCGCLYQAKTHTKYAGHLTTGPHGGQPGQGRNILDNMRLFAMVF